MPTYSKSPYSVTVSNDGKIVVKPGDMLSKYSWAIYGNYTTLNVFYRLNGGGSPVPIANKDLIYSGETLIHMPDYKKGGNGNGGGNNGGGGNSGHPSPGGGATSGPKVASTGQYKLAGGFANDLKKPPLETGYFAYRVEFNVTVQVTETNPTGIVFSQKDVAFQYQKKLSDDLQVTFGSKLIDFSTLDPAVKNNNRGLFGVGLADQAQLCFTRTLRTWGPVQLRVQAGLVANITPVRAAQQMQYSYEDVFNGIPVKVAVTGTFAFYLGLSKAGWAKLAEVVEKAAIRLFAEGVGSALVDFLLAAGVIGAAILGSLAVTYLVAWAYDNALKKGEAQAYPTWYVSAYVRKVFNEGSPRGYEYTPNPGLCRELIQLGEQDALNEAKTTLTQMGNSKANASESEMLWEYRRLLAAEAGSEQRAHDQMEYELQRKYYTAI